MGTQKGSLLWKEVQCIALTLVPWHFNSFKLFCSSPPPMYIYYLGWPQRKCQDSSELHTHSKRWFCIVNHKVFSKEWQKKCPCTHHFYPQASTFQKSFFSVWKSHILENVSFAFILILYWSYDCPNFVASPFKAKIGLEIDYLKEWLPGKKEHILAWFFSWSLGFLFPLWLISWPMIIRPVSHTPQPLEWPRVLNPGLPTILNHQLQQFQLKQVLKHFVFILYGKMMDFVMIWPMFKIAIMMEVIAVWFPA